MARGLAGVALASARGIRERHPLDDLETVARQADEPKGIVGEPADLADADVAQDLSADAEVAEDAGAWGCEAGARRLPAGALRNVKQVEPASGAPEIEDDAASLGRDPLHGAVEQRARVARRVGEDVTRQIFEVRSHQHRL